MTDRGTGKTTELIEEAISILADLPEDHRVFITGAHSQWLYTLEHEFKAQGLVGVEFMSPTVVIRGALRGRKGVLLVDDLDDLPMKLRDLLYLEYEILMSRSS